ncbi:taste receptor type 2 member 39-like [Pyxicephalus adspersus]|uniref:taste receptor type 2 member 39-like n=1 Tax=Pyxicephalus adspersus TaxID=30357 RepID=UPI003B59D39B
MHLEGNKQNNWGYIDVLALEIVIGVLLNIFIMYIALYDFGIAKTMSNSFKILLCLSISNILFGILMALGFVNDSFSLGMFTTTYTTYIYIYILLFSVSSCAWHTATLAFFYFLKVCHFKLQCFVWMKRKISAAVPWMLCFGLLVSMLSSVSFISLPEFYNNATNTNPSLMTVLKQSISQFINVSIFVTVVPFLVISITTASTVVTLKKHGHRMKNSQTSDNTHVKSYQKVVSRLTQSMIFYVIFYAAMLISFFAVCAHLESGFWLSLLMFSSFTPLQTVLLVVTNPRLKTALMEIFSCVHVREMLSR